MLSNLICKEDKVWFREIFCKQPKKLKLCNKEKEKKPILLPQALALTLQLNKQQRSHYHLVGNLNRLQQYILNLVMF